LTTQAAENIRFSFVDRANFGATIRLTVSHWRELLECASRQGWAADRPWTFIGGKEVNRQKKEFVIPDNMPAGIYIDPADCAALACALESAFVAGKYVRFGRAVAAFLQAGNIHGGVYLS
jgi:hypothetical protein